jgi:hypothetical protein
VPVNLRGASIENVTFGVSLPQKKRLPRQFPQLVDFSIEFGAEANGIELDIQVGQARLDFERDLLGIQEALIRSGSGIIAFEDVIVTVLLK